MNLCDVNILVYAHREDTPQHEFYRNWLTDELQSSTGMYVCETILSSFIRVVTHPKIFRQQTPLPVAPAFASAIRNSDNAIGIMPGANHWPIFLRLVEKTGARGNSVPDAYLAALAIEAGATWVTADADFRAYEPELKLNLLAP